VGIACFFGELATPAFVFRTSAGLGERRTQLLGLFTRREQPGDQLGIAAL
jgi:hypothetical protein